MKKQEKCEINKETISKLKHFANRCDIELFLKQLRKGKK